jgi:hypothetical protein
MDQTSGGSNPDRFPLRNTFKLSAITVNTLPPSFVSTIAQLKSIWKTLCEWQQQNIHRILRLLLKIKSAIFLTSTDVICCIMNVSFQNLLQKCVIVYTTVYCTVFSVH